MVPEHAAHSLKGPVVILGDLPQANNLLRLILGDPDSYSTGTSVDSAPPSLPGRGHLGVTAVCQ